MNFKVKYLLSFVLLTLFVGINNIYAVSLKSNELGEYLDEYNNYSSSSAYVIGEYIFTDKMSIGTDDIMLAARSISIDDNGETNKDNLIKKMQIIEMVYNVGTDEWELIEYFPGKDEITEYDIKYIDYEEVKSESKSFVVSFNDANSYNSQTVEEGKLAQEPTTPTKEGYKFEGWYTEDDTKFDFNTPITGDISLTAKWTKTICKVSFSGMDNLDQFEDMNLNCGETITNLATPTSTDRGAFVNWYNGGEVFDINSAIDDDVILLARFEKDFIFTVTFFDGVNELKDLAQQVNEGELATRPTDPEKKGYTFVDWFNEKGNAFDFTTEIMSDIKLNADWQKNVASVSDEESLLEALSNDDIIVIELANDITLSNPLKIKRSVEFNGTGKTLKADYTSTDTSFITLESGVEEVLMENIIIDANEKARGIRINYGKLIFKDSTVKNGLNNSSSLYAAGIYVNNSSELEFINSTLENNNVYDSLQNDNYMQYSSDLFVGSITTVTIKSGNIGNVFVNGNNYGDGLLTVDGGTIENVYLEYAEEHGSTIEYNAGTISNIYISTTEEGVSEKTENPEYGSYTSIK